MQYVKSSLGQIDDSLVQAGSIFLKLYLYFENNIASYYPRHSCRMGDDIYNFNKRVSSITSRITSISRNVSNVYFAQFEQGEVSIGMAMAVVSVGLTTMCLLLFATYGAKAKRGSMMRVEVWGGAGEYGRSCYFVKIKRRK